MKVEMTCWVIALTRNTSGTLTTLFFYNHARDIWQRECTPSCMYFSEKDAEDNLAKLDVDADVIEGIAYKEEVQ